MEFIKSWKFMAIIFAILTACAIAGVIYGVTTHTEPGFLPDRPEWTVYAPESFPLRVETHLYVGGEDGHEHAWLSEGDDRFGAIGDAIRTFNTRAGWEVFVWAGHHQDGDIEVTLGAPVDSPWSDPPAHFGEFMEWANHDTPGGNSFMARPGYGAGNMLCIIHTFNVSGPGDLESLVLQHELGHCLGLAHDPFESSIMYTPLAATEDGVFPPWLTDSDRDLLRRTYQR